MSDVIFRVKGAEAELDGTNINKATMLRLRCVSAGTVTITGVEVSGLEGEGGGADGSFAMIAAQIAYIRKNPADTVAESGSGVNIQATPISL